MLELKNVHVGAIQGKRLLLKATTPPAREGANDPNSKSRWGEVIQAGEDVEGIKVGHMCMYHENSCTEFPFQIKPENGISMIENYDILTQSDIIYVVDPKNN